VAPGLSSFCCNCNQNGGSISATLDKTGVPSEAFVFPKQSVLSRNVYCIVCHFQRDKSEIEQNLLSVVKACQLWERGPRSLGSGNGRGG